MALRHQPVNVGPGQRSRAFRKEAAFRTLLAVYLGVGLFLFTRNLLTSPFDLWFYWPLFFWGWGLACHAFATYGADAPARVPDVVRTLLPPVGQGRPSSPPMPTRQTAAAPFAAEAFAAVHERLERISAMTWGIADDGLRAQLQGFGEDAESIVAAMARDRADATTVRRFDAELLSPVASVLGQYRDAARHGVPSADEAARRIVERALPLLLGRIDTMSANTAVAAPSGVPARSRP